MPSKTIAYAADGDYWKTRYSFTPSCYAYVDNHMITCTNTAASQAWRHTSTVDKCNYYGQQKGVTLTVASNQEPSRNKIFQNLSLETTLPKWNALLTTFPDSKVIHESQNSYIDSSKFLTKEGARYTDIPRASRSGGFDSGSSANIVFLGRRDEYTTEGKLVLLDNMSQVSTALNEEAVLIGYNGPVPTCIVNGQAQIYTGQENAVRVSGNEGDTSGNSITLSGDAAPAIFSPIFFYLYLAYPDSIDGDSLRGRVCVLTLESAAFVGWDFELHAINVDYEYSGLDT
jgi:hypothetical protein